jgi:hypothetical protein
MRTLLIIAVAIFAIWLFFHLIGAIFGGLINLLWIIIVIALVVWVVRLFTGGRQRTY